MQAFDIWFREYGLCAAWMLFSTLGVFIGFMYVHAYAVWDFKPKYRFPPRRAGRRESYTGAVTDSALAFEPIVQTRELSKKELGIEDFGNLARLSAEEQRQIKIHDHVRDNIHLHPEDAAQVIKSWLSGE